jgi:hypothetical protein
MVVGDPEEVGAPADGDPAAADGGEPAFRTVVDDLVVVDVDVVVSGVGVDELMADRHAARERPVVVRDDVVRDVEARGLRVDDDAAAALGALDRQAVDAGHVFPLIRVATHDQDRRAFVVPHVGRLIADELAVDAVKVARERRPIGFQTRRG